MTVGRVVPLLVAAWSVACHIPMARDYQAAADYEKHKILKVAVMPAVNDELDESAPGVITILAGERLAERGYEPVDPDKTASFLRQNFGAVDGGRLKGGGVDQHKKICTGIGADGLLYPTVMQWNTITLGAYNEVAVEVAFRMIACDTGREVWQAQDDRKRNTVDINPARMVFQTLTIAQQPYAVVAEEVVYNCIDSLPDGPKY